MKQTFFSNLPENRQVAGSNSSFYPRATLKCRGPGVFRSQAVRDYACLLDLDSSVSGWSCRSIELTCGSERHSPDFCVCRSDGGILVDIDDGGCGPPGWIGECDLLEGRRYVKVLAEEFRGSVRLANAKDLLRYGRMTCPLGDRIRLLAALDDAGSMPFAECLKAFQEIRPIAGLASLILHRFVEADLDEARIGPDTAVSRVRD